MASMPPNCSITATTKPYQNHHYPQNHLKTTRTITSTNLTPKSSPSRSPLLHLAMQRTHHHRRLCSPLPDPHSFPFPSLAHDSSKKMHLGRPKTIINTRHTSIAEEVLQLALHNGQAGLQGVLVKFESKLCGSDDYTFLLGELGNRGEYEKAIKCFKFAVRRERRKTEQGKQGSAMISILGRLGKVEHAKGIFETALSEGYEDTVYAFSALIRAFGRSEYCDEAIKVLDSMKNYGLKPKLVTYNAVIDACGKGGVEFKRVVEIC